MSYTVIAPVYNEEDNILPLVGRISEVMNRLGKEYEILIVDDGSTDGTLEKLKKLTQNVTNLLIISLDKNSGQTVALQAGFDHAMGERIITIDGDLQMDPSYIAGMVEKMDAENLDLVYFKKVYVDVPFMKRFASWIANRFRRVVTGDKAADVGSNYKLYRENVFRGRNFCSGLHRFFTGFMEIEGVSMGYVEGTISKRARGVSKYSNWTRLRQGLADLYYFFMYKNGTGGLVKIGVFFGTLIFIVGMIPIDETVRVFLFISLAFFVLYILSLALHSARVIRMRKSLPYRVKGIWSAGYNVGGRW